jgi:hypothetical protein
MTASRLGGVIASLGYDVVALPDDGHGNGSP